ncbi:MAG: nucleotidyl transferase AbiEii/AbiGii toxin family protein [Pirellulales bacterium]|nr:nucleotidyl transferase AbiEii/AbiGii toxin family protein [Pirellulales bacterium]
MPGNLVLQTLRHVWLAIKPLDVPMAAVGGIALAAWKHVRATKDIDLLLGVGADSLDAIIPRLAEAGIRQKRARLSIKLGQMELVQLFYEPPEAMIDMQIDLLLADSPYHKVALQRCVSATLPEMDVEIAVLSCEDLILHKLLAGRMIDLADASALLRANQNALDLEYLNRWAEALRVNDLLARVSEEAINL